MRFRYFAFSSYFLNFLIIQHVSSRFFCYDRFGKQFWLVLGSTFGALEDQEVTKMLSKFNAQICIGKSRFKGCPSTNGLARLVARRGLRGEVNFPPGAMRFGRKEEKKKGRKNERTKGKFED